MTPRLARRQFPLALLTLLALSCAAPSELARRGEAALAGGDPRRAWELSTKALQRQPGNAGARATAAAALQAITDDWVRRIRVVAMADSLAAAGQVLELAGFRAQAAPYAQVPVDSAWAAEEQALRRSAARLHYRRGEARLEADRPKAAWLELQQVERFVPGFGDIARLSTRAYDRAATPVAFLPLRGSSSQAGLGREVAEAWRREVARRLAERGVRFTRVVSAEEVERLMTVAELGRLSREEAVRLGRRLGARRVVWGAIGGTETDTRTDRFTDLVLRRVKEKDAGGREVVRWVDVPIEVVARERSVTVEVEYEILSTDEEVTLAGERVERSLAARTLWTSYAPEADPDDYALVADPLRASDPERARRVESRWKAVAGERTSLRQVLHGVKGVRGRPTYRRDLLPRFYPGAAGPVFLDDLPPAADLAYAALVHAWDPVLEDLARMDAVDDIDLVPTPGRPE